MKRNTTDMILPESRISLKLLKGPVMQGKLIYIDSIGVSIRQRVVYEYQDPYQHTYAPDREEMRLYPWTAIENLRYGFIHDDGRGITDASSVDAFEGGIN
jgi:hypothetical protein